MSLCLKEDVLLTNNWRNGILKNILITLNSKLKI